MSRLEVPISFVWFRKRREQSEQQPVVPAPAIPPQPHSTDANPNDGRLLPGPTGEPPAGYYWTPGGTLEKLPWRGE